MKALLSNGGIGTLEDKILENGSVSTWTRSFFPIFNPFAEL